MTFYPGANKHNQYFKRLYTKTGGEVKFPLQFLNTAMDIAFTSFYNLIDQNQIEKRYSLCPIWIISMICLKR